MQVTVEEEFDSRWQMPTVIHTNSHLMPKALHEIKTTYKTQLKTKSKIHADLELLYQFVFWFLDICSNDPKVMSEYSLA